MRRFETTTVSCVEKSDFNLIKSCHSEGILFLSKPPPRLEECTRAARQLETGGKFLFNALEDKPDAYLDSGQIVGI